MARSPVLSRRDLLALMGGALMPGAEAGAGPTARAGTAAGGYALYDTPRYRPGFGHFDYVNPKAPVGGTLWLAPPLRVSAFDKLNPFTLRGTAPPGLGLLVFESLMIPSWDEANSVYPLLATGVEVAADARSALFHLDSRARFVDGSAVTAADVVHSFHVLSGPFAAPAVQLQFSGIAAARALDPLRVRFTFRGGSRDTVLVAAGMPVFSAAWTRGRPLDQVVDDPPVASGPYRIERVVGERDVIYARRPDYWGWALPSRRGQFNFARIGYKLFGDETARLEGFKAGDFDLIEAYIARDWARQYRGRRFDDGTLVKRLLPNHNPAGFQGMVMNLRRPLFADPRVRRALTLALDFQWLNRMVFYGQYARVRGYFANSPFQAEGVPGPAELALLEPLRGRVPATVFGPLPELPSTDAPGSLRANLLAARALLREAGWHWRDGALRDAAGRAFSFEVLDAQAGMAPVIEVWARALAKLGITVNLRLVDPGVYEQRVEHFDFDVTTTAYPGSPSPGSELLDRFGSRAADVVGSGNLWGLRDPAVDRLIGHVLAARDGAELVAACRALDRVLVCGDYSVPEWYAPDHRLAWRAHVFGMPARLPLYYSAEEWAASCWWSERAGGGRA